MNQREPHDIWIEQCEAAQTIKQRYGLKAAFDYVVAEKLMNFAAAASGRTEFARELPRFVAQVRSLFTPEEMRAHIRQLERERNAREAEAKEDDELFRESPAEAAARSREFMTIKEFLTAPQLGIS